MRSLRIGFTLALALAACGGKSKEAPTITPPPADGSATAPDGTGSAATGPTCEAQGGTCMSKAAAVSCASWPEASDCGASDGCCVLAK